MNKTIVVIIILISLVLSACGSAAPSPAVAVAQVVEHAQEDVVQATDAPTQAPTNPPLPTPIIPTPTSAPEVLAESASSSAESPAEAEAASGVFMTSGVTLEDLADELPIYDVLQGDVDTLANLPVGNYFSALFFKLTGDYEPLTVFIPMYTQSDVNGKFTSLGQFTEALTYHTVPGLYLGTDLQALDGQTIPSRLPGQEITISVRDGAIYLNDIAMLVHTDILAQKAIIHVIDAFLFPPGE
jgi:uncharacterized surface protein with fasciclin (FAS1) repeats